MIPTRHIIEGREFVGPVTDAFHFCFKGFTAKLFSGSERPG